MGGWSLINGVNSNLLLPGITLVLYELLVDLLHRNRRVLSILIIRYKPIGRDLLDVYGIAGQARRYRPFVGGLDRHLSTYSRGRLRLGY